MMSTSWLPSVALVAGLFAVCLGGRPAQAVEVEWGFDSAALTPVFNDHTTYMSYYNGATTSSVVSFGTASSYGIPAMPGGDATVMHFPAFAQNQGIAIDELGPGGSGGGLTINQYTLAWDVLFPTLVGHNYTALYQTTDPFNSGDADLFIRGGTAVGDNGGIGIGGQYAPGGSVTGNAWHRIVVTVDLAAVDPALRMKKFVNGALVATQALDGIDNRHSLLPPWYPDLQNFFPGAVGPPTDHAMYILTDEDNETNEGYISSFYYTDHVISDATVAAWGGSKAGGVPGPGDVNFDGFVDIFDINLVSANWGTPGGPTGDANGDGNVDIFDVNLISSNWRPSGGGSSAVPEPSTFALAGLCGLALLALRRRK